MEAKKPGENSRPKICTSIVGRTKGDIFYELAHILGKRPDMIEWRADFFKGLDDAGAVVDVAKDIKAEAGDIPLVFTIRSPQEGGQIISLPEEGKFDLRASICTETGFEYLDVELADKRGNIEFLRRTAHAWGKKIIASFHQCEYTPDVEILCSKIAAAEEYGLDAAKIAVMPRDMKDVLTLLNALITAREKFSIPIIAISMGRYGVISRLAGGLFGSSVTFAVGHNASAPGQVDIEDLRCVLEIIEKSAH